jgi:hypothetical protein
MPAVCSLDPQAASRKRLATSSGCGVSHDFDGGGLTFVAHCAVRTEADEMSTVVFCLCRRSNWQEDGQTDSHSFMPFSFAYSFVSFAVMHVRTILPILAGDRLRAASKGIRQPKA